MEVMLCLSPYIVVVGAAALVYYIIFEKPKP
jgi:hypothetical protein